MGAKEKIIGAVVVVAIVATMFIGASYWIGGLIEQGFQEGVQRASKFGFRVTLVDYERGLFGATARTEVVLPIGPENAPPIAFNHDIQYGRLPFLTPVARIHTELLLPSLSEVSDSAPSDGKAPFVVDTEISWKGAQHHRLASPKLDADLGDNQTRVAWTGFDGEIEVSSGQSQLEMKLDSGNLTLKEESGAVYNIEFEKLRANGKMNITDGVAGIETRLDADGIIVRAENKETIRNVGLTLLYENIDARLFSQAMQDEDESENDENAENAESEKEEKATLAMLLRHKPSFSIKNIGARWPEGEASGSFRIAYAGSDPDKFAPENDLSGDLQLSVPRAVVLRLLTAQIADEVADQHEDGEASEENIAIETKKEVETQFKSILDRGLMLEKTPGILTVDAHFQDNVLQINGQSESPEVLLELMPFPEFPEVLMELLRLIPF
jgi:uncharacterized protein YdgA (DUF945 family)